MQTETKLREVELPCCEVCGHVGKLPNQRRMQFDCTGPPGDIHKRSRMRMRVFREVPKDEA